jgi:hypothetical protein
VGTAKGSQVARLNWMSLKRQGSFDSKPGSNPSRFPIFVQAAFLFRTSKYRVLATSHVCSAPQEKFSPKRGESLLTSIILNTITNLEEKRILDATRPSAPARRNP